MCFPRVYLWVNIFTCKMLNFGSIHINIITSLFPTLNPPGQLEPWQLPADLCLRGQDREALGCWCRYSRYNFQHGHWSGRPAAGLPVAERLSPWHLLVRIHQLSGQEQPWPAHTHHQGRTLKCLWKLFQDIANAVFFKGINLLLFAWVDIFKDLAAYKLLNCLKPVNSVEEWCSVKLH